MVFSPTPRKLDGLTSDLPDREGGTTPGVTIRFWLVQTPGPVARLSSKGLSGIGPHPGQSCCPTVNRGLYRIKAGVQRLDLRHHLFIYVKAAGGIYYQHILELLAGKFVGVTGDRKGFSDAGCWERNLPPPQPQGS